MSRLVRAAAALALSGGLVLAGIQPASAAPVAPAPNTQSRAVETLRPAIALLKGDWSGYVQYPAVSGSRWSDPVKASFYCSGVMVSNDGAIATAGHCVDPEEAQDALIRGMFQMWREHRATSPISSFSDEEAQNLEEKALKEGWEVQGYKAGSKPTLTMTALTQESPQQATPVTVLPGYVGLSGGDVAVVKGQFKEPQPAASIASTTPGDGVPMVAAGYPASVAAVTDAQVDRPTFTPGQTTGPQTSQGAAFVGISAALAQGMSGGPLATTDGLVFGTVSFGPGGETQTLNYGSDTGTLQRVLKAGGISTTPSVADRAWRKGLKHYYDGEYHQAAGEFDKVLRAMPNHPTVKKFRNDAAAKDDGSGALAVGLIALLGVAVLIVVAVVMAVVMIRRRRRRQARPTLQCMPHRDPVPPPMPPQHGWPTQFPGNAPPPMPQQGWPGGPVPPGGPEA
jgi:hypothetical protein